VSVTKKKVQRDDDKKVHAHFVAALQLDQKNNNYCFTTTRDEWWWIMVARGSGAEGVKIYSLFWVFSFSPERDERDEKPPFYLFFVSLSSSLSRTPF